MCGRVFVDYHDVIEPHPQLDLYRWLQNLPEGWDPQLDSNWNLAPTQQIPVAITHPETRERFMERAHWGIIPPWSKDGTARFTFNARIETVQEKRTFAPSLTAKRCAVAVSGFYEWTGEKKSRKPHAIFGPQPLLSMAGLYGWYQRSDATWQLTATILTTEARGKMAELHDRMPVFLGADLLERWLDPSQVAGADLLQAIALGAEKISYELEYYEVAPLKGNGPQLLQRLDEGTLDFG